MPGIIPGAAQGGVITRDGAGNCLDPANVTNFYCPAPEFNSTCTINYLPNGCDARITAAQINAFQAEMLCFAETMAPEGTWNCGSLCNLSSNFTQWLRDDTRYDGSFLDAMQDHLCARPEVTDLLDGGYPQARGLFCDGDGNVVRHNIPLPPEVEAGDFINVNVAAGPNGQLIYTIEALTTVVTSDDASVTIVETATLDGARSFDLSVAAGGAPTLVTSDDNTVTIIETATPEGGLNFDLSVNVCGAGQVALPEIGFEMVVCTPDGIRRLPLESINPACVSISGCGNNGGLPNPAVFGEGVGIVYPSPDTTVINNPHPVPLLAEVTFSHHQQHGIFAGDRTRTNVRVFADGVLVDPCLDAHVVVWGPTNNRTINDDANMNGSFSILVPAGGAVTLTTEWELILSNPPAHPQTRGASMSTTFAWNASCIRNWND